MRRWKMLPALSTLLAVSLAACAAPLAPRAGQAPDRPAEVAAPRRITAAVMSSPPFLSTKLQTALIEGLDNIQELLTVGLTTPDNQARLRPRLAAAVPTIENGLWQLLPDGRMETTWKIRPDAVWHGGTPFTSRDVVFTARVDQDRDHNTLFANILAGEVERSRKCAIPTISTR